MEIILEGRYSVKKRISSTIHISIKLRRLYINLSICLSIVHFCIAYIYIKLYVAIYNMVNVTMYFIRAITILCIGPTYKTLYWSIYRIFKYTFCMVIYNMTWKYNFFCVFFFKPGFHSVYYRVTMPRFVTERKPVFGIIHCISYVSIAYFRIHIIFCMSIYNMIGNDRSRTPHPLQFCGLFADPSSSNIYDHNHIDR